MDDDRLREMFEKCDGEFLKFDRIPEADRLHPAKKLCGMLKVAALMKDPSQWSVHAEHDVVYLADASDLRDDVTEADVLYLNRCSVRMGEYGLEMFT